MMQMMTDHFYFNRARRRITKFLLIVFILCLFISKLIYAETVLIEDYTSPKAAFNTFVEAVKSQKFDVVYRAYSPLLREFFPGDTTKEKIQSIREAWFKELGENGFRNLKAEFLEMKPYRKNAAPGNDAVLVKYVNATLNKEAALIAVKVHNEWKIGFPLKETGKEAVARS